MASSRPIAAAAALFLAVALGTAHAATENGLVRKESPHGVYATIDKLRGIIADNGLTIFTEIDHSAGAQRAELELRPTRILIFGNPRLGTPLMGAAATTAIDLPQKLLVYRDDDGAVWVVHNDPAWLKGRHGIEGQDDVLAKITTALDGITDAAVAE